MNTKTAEDELLDAIALHYFETATDAPGRLVRTDLGLSMEEFGRALLKLTPRLVTKLGSGFEDSYRPSLLGMMKSDSASRFSTVVDHVRGYLTLTFKNSPVIESYSWDELKSALGLTDNDYPPMRSSIHLANMVGRRSNCTDTGAPAATWAVPVDIELIANESTRDFLARRLQEEESAFSASPRSGTTDIGPARKTAAELLATRLKQRNAFLHRVYEVSGADPYEIVDAYSIAEVLGFEERDVASLIDYWDSHGALEPKTIGGGVSITQRGIDAVERALAEREQREERRMAADVTRKSGIRVFVSHAADDKELVKQLVALLDAGLALPDGAIRCTTLPGYELPLGTHAADQLREELAACDVVVGVITPKSLASPWVLFELGACWGRSKHTILLLRPDVAFGSVQGPFGQNHMGKLDNRHALHGLVDQIASAIGCEKKSSPRISGAIEDLVETAAKFNMSGH